VTALFETMLAIDGRIVQLDEHIERMARSCRELQLGSLDENEFRRAASGAVGSAEHAIRVVYDRGAIAASAFAIPEITRARRAHGRAMTVVWRRPVPQHKRFPEDVELREWIAPGADEALFVTNDGAILEGTSTNVFAVRGDVLITAPDDILPGIVRAWVLATAPTLGLHIEERTPTADDICRGSFFTGSLTTLVPIRTLDGRACAPPGEGYAELARLYGVPWIAS